MQGRDVTLFSAARRRIGLVIVSTVVGVAAAIGAVLATAPMYTSSTQLYLTLSPDAAGGRDVFSSLDYVEGRASSYAALVSNESLQNAVADAVGDGADPELTSTVEPRTSLLTISAADRTAELAQRSATIAAEQLRVIALPLDGVFPTGAPPGTPAQAPLQLIVSEPADLPGSPTSPVVPLYLAVGLVVGAGVGLGAAAVAARTDDRIGKPDDLGDLANHVGPVFWLPVKRWRGPASVLEREDYMLRLAALHHELTALPGSRGQVLVLTAPTSGSAEASSRVAEDLVATLTEGGRSAILAVTHSRGPSTAPGLSDILAGTHTSATTILSEGPRRTVGPGSEPFRLLTATGREVRALLMDLGRTSDVIVIDAPDLTAPAGTAVFSMAADAVLVVAGRGDARAEELLDARATIKRWGAGYLGVLLAPSTQKNLVPAPRRSSTPTSTPSRTEVIPHAPVGGAPKG